MKKNIMFLIISFFLISVQAEVIEWKGMEFGKEQNPRWLSNFIRKGDERLLRKKFEIKQGYTIFFGTGNSSDLPGAQAFAYSDCIEKLALKNKNDLFLLKTFSPVYEFWELDDCSGYTVYCVYKVKLK